jgi:hypothetical protein
MLYEDGAPEIGITETPAWGMLRKTQDFFGESKAFSSKIGKQSGKSRTFTNSRANSGPSTFKRWIVTRGMDFVTCQIGVSAYEALGNNKGAQLSLVEEQTKDTYDCCMLRLERNIFRNAGGSITTIASGGATDTITVDDPETLIALDLGDWLVSSTDDGAPATAGVDAGGAKQISGIDRIAGTITTDTEAAWNTGGGFADGSYIFIDGDYGLNLSGLPTWMPATVTPGQTLYGLDISVDERLHGIKYVASAGAPDGSIARALRNAATLCHHHGGKPNKLFMNTLDFGEWVNDLGNAAQYVTEPAMDIDGKKLDVGYSGVRLMMPYGPVSVFANRFVSRHTVWGLDYSDFSFEGMLKTPRWMTLDGNKWFRMASDNLHAIEGYIYYEGQFVLRNPGNHFRADISALF